MKGCENEKAKMPKPAVDAARLMPPLDAACFIAMASPPRPPHIARRTPHAGLHTLLRR
ncbi:hypothetical protein VDGL01_12611 [Verticillium dahliae]